MNRKVFVDGHEGTTGLEIHDYLSKRPDLEILHIAPEKRKDTDAKRILLNEADIAILCLPDTAARESVALVTNDKTRIIDCSTAFRTDPQWAYGLPELNNQQRELIANSPRVSVPGCHATAFVLGLYPLIQEGIVPRDYPISCCSITGYSGGGRRMIEKYQSQTKPENLHTPRHYALKLDHKHMPEMQTRAGLTFAPIFSPVVGDFYRGLAVTTPLATRLLCKNATASDIHDVLSSHYASERFVQVMPFNMDTNLDEGFFDIEGCNNTNRADIFVFGNDERVLLMARIDNLGKGASGAAIQNLNIMLGLDEGLGLKS